MILFRKLDSFECLPYRLLSTACRQEEQDFSSFSPVLVW